MRSRGCSRRRRSSRSVNVQASALGRDRARLARAVLGRAEAKEARAGSAAAGRPGRAEGKGKAAAPEGRDETEMMRVTKQARPLTFALIAAAMLALAPAGRLA